MRGVNAPGRTLVDGLEPEPMASEGPSPVDLASAATSRLDAGGVAGEVEPPGHLTPQPRRCPSLAGAGAPSDTNWCVTSAARISRFDWASVHPHRSRQ